MFSPIQLAESLKLTSEKAFRDLTLEKIIRVESLAMMKIKGTIVRSLKERMLREHFAGLDRLTEFVDQNSQRPVL